MKFLIVIWFFIPCVLLSQAIPSESENIESLITFGKDAPSAWGDDDNVQVFFALIPESFKESFYIRVFDPNVGGFLDANNDGIFDSKTRFSIYGGDECYSHQDARKTDPVGEFKSGVLLDSKEFADEKKYDMRWYNFGPFNPLDGEYDQNMNGYVFKIIAEGFEGNDGNLYSYFISTSDVANKAINGANAFTYEYTFRLKSKGNVAHIYPFIDEDVIAIKQYNFDLDEDGALKLFSIAKNGHNGKVSGNDVWNFSSHDILESEKLKCIDLQLHRNDSNKNDLSIYVLNQYNEAVRFFSSPLGSHKYIYQFSVIPKE
ncbi:MAG: hypothetical protein AAF487_05830 [Bacteroidota bacterium]